MASYPFNVIADYLSKEIEKAYNQAIEKERYYHIKDDDYDMFAEGYAACYIKYQKILREMEKQYKEGDGDDS